MSATSADQAVSSILARDDLHLTPDEVTRLVGLYAELQPQLATLRMPEARYAIPATIYPAAST